MYIEKAMVAVGAIDIDTDIDMDINVDTNIAIIDR